MRIRSGLALAALMAALIGSSLAMAAPVVGTGNPAAGTPGAEENNWTLSQGDAYVVNPATPYWVNPASDATVTAKWITPYLDATQSSTMTGLGFTCTVFCPGDDPTAYVVDSLYTYTLTFDDPNQTLNIKWATDNGAEFFLNGSLLSQAGPGGLSALTAFQILADAFLDGSNTFSIVVRNLQQTNGGNPTGLIVDVSAVPLPPAVLLFGTALIGLNWMRRRGLSEKRKVMAA